MNTNNSHADRLREIGYAIANARGSATFGTAYEAALVAGLDVLTNERETVMAIDNATHARHIRQALDDVRAGRSINTGGEVQAALEAAATQLEGRDDSNRAVNVGDAANATREVRAGDEQNPPNHVHPPSDQPVGRAPGVVPAVGTVPATETPSSPAPADAPHRTPRQTK